MHNIQGLEEQVRPSNPEDMSSSEHTAGRAIPEEPTPSPSGTGAAAQAAGILNNETAVDVAARWNVSDGPRLAASAVDSAAIERNQCIREAAHELNSLGFFNILQSRA